MGKWRMSHVSWVVGHLRVPPSWDWRGGGLRVPFRSGAVCCCCVGTAPVRFSVQLALIGIALVLKVMDWGPKDVPANLGTFSGRCLQC